MVYDKSNKMVFRKWFLIDAENIILGRLASRVAEILRGKNKNLFSNCQDFGDYVIILNSQKICLSGKKNFDKKYYRYTGYVGGLKVIKAYKMREDFPNRIVFNAVKGMLPKNVLGRKMISKLKIYRDDQHPHAAQKPCVININGISNV